MPSAFIIQSPGKADCKALSRCISEVRGRHYYSKEHYDPVYLLDSGKYDLFAAYDEYGEILGFTGLTNERFCQSRTVLSLLNVRPQYTGRGIATALLEHSVHILRERGEKAIKGNAVTRHASIQRVLEDLGLRPTGILPGVRDGRNAEHAVREKCALTVHVCNLAVDGALTLYLHHDIAGLGESVYAGLDVDANILSDGLPVGTSVFEHQYDAHDTVLFIQVISCGPGISGELRKLVDSYKTPHLTVIALLNLGMPAAIFGYEALRDDGWRFSGFDSLGQYENAIFFSGNVSLADMALSERTREMYEKLHL